MIYTSLHRKKGTNYMNLLFFQMNNAFGGCKISRKFIGIDSSDVAINVIKSRLSENGITYN